MIKNSLKIPKTLIEGQTIQWQTENYKKTYNDLQNTTQKDKD